MSDFIISTIETSRISAKQIMDWAMALPKGKRPFIGSKLVYVSGYRPLRDKIAADLKNEGAEVVDIADGSKSLVLSNEPLSPATIATFELTPVGKAEAWALLSVTELPIELQHPQLSNNHVRAALIHKGTKEESRLTYFEEEIGPTGHAEGPYDELVRMALSLGYRRLSPGIVDNIMSTVS